ncbi:OmpA family protein [Chryseolinea sp. T2]|uniref:OmpA family protein n=1 Tax=Chryseolinea sp. T2 TaxID=3129255 RepID=UPI0030781312
MKTPNFFALVGLFFTLCLLQPTTAAPYESQQLDNAAPNYVVIGAFAKQSNALRFTNHAKRDVKLDARFEMNKRRNLYYVYVLSTHDLPIAIEEAKRLRVESEFTDTWVYVGSFADLTSAGHDIVIVPNRPEISSSQPQASNGIATANATDSYVAPADATPQDASGSSVNSAAPASTEINTSETAATTPPIEEASTAFVDDGTEGTKFFFKITRQADQKKLQGDVDIIDVDRTRKMGSYKGNTVVKVASPASKSGNMSIICDVFGYRKSQRDLSYSDPESGGDIIRDSNGAVVVPFELTRLKKGDIAIMYNVYFFKDASVMRPESRFEVNSLLDMLNENPKYKIRLHGHTNGNAAGKIISMGKESDAFFALSDTKEGFGSAKQLSEERASIIRDYLVKNGIPASRMEIKAWGGKKPIHDKMSPRAAENVRVEVEILED